MKKVKLLISFLLLMLFTSSQVKAESSPKAQDVPVYKEKRHLGTRTTEPSVTASLEQNQLTVNVSRYMGLARVYVYDANGNIVAITSLFVDGMGQCTLGLANLSGGFYEVVIELFNENYVGTFEF